MMAAKGQAMVGSTAWIAAEEENVMQLLNQEKEEIIFPAQHEAEWLNEHMAEIFSRHQFNVTDVFKTPGKLRGKSPRTARKRPGQDARIPLSDVFSTNLPPATSPGKTDKLTTQDAQFVIPKDLDEPSTQLKSHLPTSKAHTDSGYHGSSQDEWESDVHALTSPYQLHAQIAVVHKEDQQGTEKAPEEAASAESRTTEGSFHSAKEDNTAKVSLPEEKQPETGPEHVEAHAKKDLKDQEMRDADIGDAESKDIDAVNKTKSTIFENEFDDIGSPSDGSTPDRPLVRKSSLTFASLPAREPLNRSMGARISRTSQVDQTKTAGQTRSSYLARQTGGLRLTQTQPDKVAEDEDQQMGGVEGGEEPDHDEHDEETKTTKLHSKSSTQRLHEKIDMLGKVQQTRLSKSIPSASGLVASHLKQSEASSTIQKPVTSSAPGAGSVVDDDDDWIKPLKSPQPLDRGLSAKSNKTDMTNSVADNDTEDEDGFDMRAPELIAHEERMKTPVRASPRPERTPHVLMHTKSASTATLASPSKATMAPTAAQMKTVSVSNPPHPTTTPQGSPKRMLDGPLTASKSRLQSIMKTAKGLFTSSAGVSAAAKMETLSPNAIRIAANNMPGLYPNLNALLEDKPLPASPPKESRRTRSSIEREKKREKEAKAIQKAEDHLERAREIEKQKATQHRQAQEKVTAPKISQPTRTSPRRIAEEQRAAEKVTDTADMQPPTLSAQPSKLSRPTRPTREAASKPKPQPVAIRVGTLSQRLPLSNAALASTLPDVLPAAAASRPAPVTRKASNTSLQSSTSGPLFKSSVSSQVTKPKAILAAERRKEQDERETQRKLDQKRENERKRAPQQEETRRQEQRQRAEAEKKEQERIAAELAKRAAQQQALERKRLENERKLEQQRAERAANEMALASSRPASRMGSTQPHGRSVMNTTIPTNPAKPAKRPHEEDAGPSRQQAPKFGAASQLADSKRRKTEDENIPEPIARPTMTGAPIRQSSMAKKPSIFAHPGYAAAPPQISQTTQAQSLSQPFPYQANSHQVTHPSGIAKYANGAKIPFADAPNPPSHTTKTPASGYHHPKTVQHPRSSPHYPHGEAINLPEIPTDSEDEESGDEGNAFPVPDWATPGHLTNQLMQQEGVDVDAVFGPIAPLKMEEIFSKGNKDRLKRMRDRTSSANWAVSGDGLTLEEVKVDKELRERMRLEGGWRYGT